MEITIRNLTGMSASVAAEPFETVGKIRRRVQDQWGSKYILRLHLRVSQSSRKPCFSSMHLVEAQHL